MNPTAPALPPVPHMKSLPSAFMVVLLASLPGLSPLAHAQGSSTAAAREARVIPLDDLISGDKLWATTTEEFEQKFKQSKFQWLSQAKDQARFFGNYGLWNGEVKVAEAIVEFQNAKLFRLSLSIFNRGDSAVEVATRKAFEKRVDDCKNIITSHLGAQPKDRGRDAASAVKALGMVWTKSPSMYLLEWSFEKENPGLKQDFRAEFIRLRVAQEPKPQGLLASSAPAGAAGQPVLKSSLAANVTRTEGGDVVIKNVPMVDQGPKGYCAVATAERVFKYYGIPVDQHEMAQVANTQEGGGTSPTQMLKALTALEARLHVKVRAISKWEYGEFSRMIADYNREAKHDKKHEVKLQTSGTIDIGEIYSEMDPEALKSALTVKNKANFSKFMRTASAMIDRGVPLMWGVQLGLYKEAEIPQAGGGHMRLIIGYNNKTNEILYSDSWGEAHALKRMPADNAFPMTTGLYYMEPLR